MGGRDARGGALHAGHPTTATMHTEHDFRFESGDLGCVACGHEQLVVEPDSTVICPNCAETYALVVREGFALIERGGWATRVTFDVPEELAPDVARG